MEEINLKQLFDYFKERILLILIIILSVLVIGSVYSIILKKPMYMSDSTVVLASDNSDYSSNDVTLNKSLVATYSEIIKSRRVVDQVIENLSLDCTTDDLKSRITVSSISNTEIIKIMVEDSDNSLAADVTNEVVKVFSDEVKSIYKLQNVSVVDVAQEESTPYNVNIFKDLIIYILIGAVLAIAIVFLMYYFDTTIKSADEIEERFGLPIFGVVPKVKRKEK